MSKNTHFKYFLILSYIYLYSVHLLNIISLFVEGKLCSLYRQIKPPFREQLTNLVTNYNLNHLNHQITSSKICNNAQFFYLNEYSLQHYGKIYVNFFKTIWVCFYFLGNDKIVDAKTGEYYGKQLLKYIKTRNKSLFFIIFKSRSIKITLTETKFFASCTRLRCLVAKN